jgi:phosphonate utilization transcriptional regulator
MNSHEPGETSATAASQQMSAIDLLQSHSLTTLVQHEIERLIVSGELSAGDKLNEAVLAERLGVSRGPVREAFRALAESGLVRMEKNRGVFVREVSLEEADEIYEVRAALDRLVGRRLAESIRPEQLKELRGILDGMEQATAKHDIDAYYPLNLRFHDSLVQFTGNKKLLATYRRIVNELNLYRRETLASSGGGLPVSTREHREIYDAIASGDPELAGQALYDHVAASRERMHRAKGLPEPVKTPRTRKAA